MEEIQAIVVGAGVIGLACGRALARKGIETIILERAQKFGTEISSRNSEVIHAGIYYEPNSFKAKLCARGKEQLYRFCHDFNVPFKRCGKLIVSSNETQFAKLEEIYNRGIINGVCDLRFLSKHEALQFETALNCDAALYSPSTGILSSHDFMLKLLGDAESHGGYIVYKTPMIQAKLHSNYFEVITNTDQLESFRTSILINAGGLSAPDIARSIDGFPCNLAPTYSLAKGNYFSLSCKSPFSHLIYPVPEPGGLGVHLTLDLAGQARFGPDVEWVDEINYDVDPKRADKFYNAIRSYWPKLPDLSLIPAYSGIRPKISVINQGDADFIIQDESIHGISGLINLFGIESPGLTSSLAIADTVVDALNL